MAKSGPELLAAFEQQVAHDKAVNFRGTARVPLVNLDFRNPIRPFDHTVAARLKRDFTKAGCLHHELDYSIPAIIENHILESALGKLGVRAEAFKATSSHHPPELPLPHNVKLECLHGQHRVCAAKDFLSKPEEQWWTVDIYGNGLADKTKQRLREGYSYSVNYTDGEIFRQTRLCQFHGDDIGVSRWLGRLSPAKARDIKTLLKRAILVKALDTILPYRGLWKAFKLGSMDVFLPLKCDEEISYAIIHIKTTLDNILNHDDSLIEFLDESTIEAIELRAPGVSKFDYSYIQSKMQSGKLFPGIKDSFKRDDVMRHLLAIDYIIPSLHYLFGNIRNLEPAAEALKALIPPFQNATIRESLHAYFRTEENRSTISVQTSEISTTNIAVSSEKLFVIAIKELWACSLRYFANSPASAKRDMNPVKRTIYAPSYFLWFRLVELAHNLGFSSPEIRHALGNDPVKKSLGEMLRSIPREMGALSQEQIVSITEILRNELSKSTAVTYEKLSPSATISGLGEPLHRRCGRLPDEDPYNDDRNHLFLQKLYTKLSEYHNGGEGISSFFVKRCRYLSFFGPTLLSDISHFAIMETSWESKISEPVTLVQGVGNGNGPVNQALSTSVQNNSHLLNEQDGNVLDVSNFESTHRDVILVTFRQNGTTLSQVPFLEQAVNDQAAQLALLGKSLSIERAGVFIWNKCFEKLVEYESTTVEVTPLRRDTVIRI